MLKAIIVSSTILAHSWYPGECCSDRDCQPVPQKEVKIVPGGYSYKGIFIPDNMVRNGKDDNFHACLSKAVPSTIICFFRPYSGT